MVCYRPISFFFAFVFVVPFRIDKNLFFPGTVQENYFLAHQTKYKNPCFRSLSIKENWKREIRITERVHNVYLWNIESHNWVQQLTTFELWNKCVAQCFHWVENWRFYEILNIICSFRNKIRLPMSYLRLMSFVNDMIWHQG